MSSVTLVVILCIEVRQTVAGIDEHFLGIVYDTLALNAAHHRFLTALLEEVRPAATLAYPD
jgi:hypothetical protein